MPRPDRYWLHRFFLGTVAVTEAFGLFFILMLAALALSATLPWSVRLSFILPIAAYIIASCPLPHRERDWRAQRRHGRH